MRVIVQRVIQADCTIEGNVTGSIGPGLCLFVGFGPDDSLEIVDRMIKKICALRIFSDAEGKMNLSVLQAEGSVLSISQFTLYADCRRGNRPGFTNAAAPDQARELYEQFNRRLSAYVPVQTGVFGADMKIGLINDGPVTIILDSKELF